MAKKIANNENMNMVENNAAEVIENPALVQFIQENDNWVPKNQRKKYEAMTVEQKVAKIKFWQDMKKMRDEFTEKRKIENKVKDLLESRKATVEDVLKVIEYCKSYIKDCKAQELAKLDEEIARLNEMKSQLEQN